MPARSRGAHHGQSLFPDHFAAGGADTRQAEYARAPFRVRLRSSIPVGYDGGPLPEGKTADLIAVPANLYYTTIHRVIQIQPTRACFALCMVHVSTSITCNNINVDNAHVEKALCVRVTVPRVRSPYMPAQTFCPRVLASLLLRV